VVFQELARAASIAEVRLKQGHRLNLRREAVVSTYPLGYFGLQPNPPVVRLPELLREFVSRRFVVFH
jgi:hypothetical protein